MSGPSFAAPPPSLPASKRFEDLDCAGRLLVVTMRRWLDGPEAQAEVWSGLRAALGAASARRVLAAFERWLSAIAAAPRRPLRRHAACCPCLGDDEARLAALVAAAGSGRSATARELAGALVEPEATDDLLAAAEALGATLAALLDEAGHGPCACRPSAAPARLH
ncbi:MAG: hypothetical protein ACFBWO_09585 [Paracoccaceae bacterium]